MPSPFSQFQNPTNNSPFAQFVAEEEPAKESRKGYALKDLPPVMKSLYEKEGATGLLKRILAGQADLVEEIAGFNPPEMITRAILPESQKISEFVRPNEEGLSEQEKNLAALEEKALPFLEQVFTPLPGGKTPTGKVLEKLGKITEKVPKTPPPPPPSPPSSSFSLPEKYESQLGKDLIDLLFGKREPLPEAFERESLYPKKEEVISKLAPEQRVTIGGKELPVKPEYTPISQTAERKYEDLTKSPLEDVISEHEIISDKEMGNIASNTLKKEKDFHKKEIIDDIYKRARSKNEGQLLTEKGYNSLKSEMQGILAKISKQPNPGEQKVINEIDKLLNNAKEPNFTVNDLLKVADSIGEIANYDMAFPGSKGLLKEIVHATNNIARNFAKTGARSLIVKADELYGKYADKFFSDELKPFYERKILDPAALFEKASKDRGTYQALKDAIGDENKKLLDALDKKFLNEKLKKYNENPKLINSREYQQDLANLRDIIGAEKTQKADRFLRKRLKQAKVKEIGEEKSKLLSEEYEKKKTSERPRIREREKKLTPSEKAKYEKPEDIDTALNTRTGIRKLRKEMQQKGLSREFDELAADKIADVFQQGNFFAKKITGKDLKVVLDKNYEILSELLGEQNVKNLYGNASRHANVEMTKDTIYGLFKDIAKLTIGSKFLKIIFGHVF